MYISRSRAAWQLVGLITRRSGGSNPLSATNNEGYPFGCSSFFFVLNCYGDLNLPSPKANTIGCSQACLRMMGRAHQIPSPQPTNTGYHLVACIFLFQMVLTPDRRVPGASHSTAACGGCRESYLAQRSKLIATNRSANQFWAPQPTKSSLFILHHSFFITHFSLNSKSSMNIE